MIQVALNGGLGNQLFQYATAKSLAVKHNTPLFLDVLPLYGKLQFKNIATYRKYELDIFSINAERNQPIFFNRYLYPFAKMHYFLHQVKNNIQFHSYKEKSFEFDKTVLNLPDNSYLQGHFQSAKYFENISEILKEELKFREPLVAANLIWKQKMDDSDSVSIHIRRGDYLLNSKNLQKHGLTSIDYYHNAVQLISEKVTQPSFFIFTDDVQWVSEYFKINFPFEIIQNNHTPETSYIDMQLMSLCKHNIICNSTFSWWAAWLNNNSGKLVIAPQKWFEDSSINSKDIYPSEWIKL